MSKDGIEIKHWSAVNKSIGARWMRNGREQFATPEDDLPDDVREAIALQIAPNLKAKVDALSDGLRDMVVVGRLTEAMIPDDFQWLTAHVEPHSDALTL